MSYLEVQNASVSFGPVSNRTHVLRDINLSVKENEFVAVIGFSGAGKSTLMSLLAGLQPPSTGKVVKAGKEITKPGPDLGLMFQNYSLLPWLTVNENISLAVRSVFPKLNKSEVADRVAHYVKMVKLDHAGEKLPTELSGGMRQRASLARTLSLDPNVILLDEPLSALDALTRAELQDQILNIWDTDKRTVVMITNDIDEAILMADRIVPLTIGPGATLGKEFVVDMERPRVRMTLTEQPAYQRLKADISAYMLGLSDEAKAAQTTKDLSFPAVEPRDFRAPSKLPSLRWKLQTT